MGFRRLSLSKTSLESKKSTKYSTITQVRGRDFGRLIDRARKTSKNVTEKYLNNLNYNLNSFKGLRFRSNEDENEESMLDKEEAQNSNDDEIEEKVKDLAVKVKNGPL